MSAATWGLQLSLQAAHHTIPPCSIRTAHFPLDTSPSVQHSRCRSLSCTPDGIQETSHNLLPICHMDGAQFHVITTVVAATNSRSSVSSQGQQSWGGPGPLGASMIGTKAMRGIHGGGPGPLQAAKTGLRANRGSPDRDQGQSSRANQLYWHADDQLKGGTCLQGGVGGSC